MAEERIQKIIARSGLCSRRDAERAIREGRVTVNGHEASLGDRARTGVRDVALGQVGFAVGGALAGPLYAGVGYGSNAVLGAVSVLSMGLIVWFLIPEPQGDPTPAPLAPAPAPAPRPAAE